MKKYPALYTIVSLFTCGSQKEVSTQEGLTRGGIIRTSPLIRTTVYCEIVRLSSKVQTKVNILKCCYFKGKELQWVTVSHVLELNSKLKNAVE